MQNYNYGHLLGSYCGTMGCGFVGELFVCLFHFYFQGNPIIYFNIFFASIILYCLTLTLVLYQQEVKKKAIVVYLPWSDTTLFTELSGVVPLTLALGLLKLSLPTPALATSLNTLQYYWWREKENDITYHLTS